MKSINLWELIVLNEEIRHFNKDELLALGQSARFGWQELSLIASEDGWIISIFGRNETGRIEILIPKDPTKEVQILLDTTKDSAPYRDL